MYKDNTTSIALIIGSSNDARRASQWPKDVFKYIVAINNAWRIRADWDFLIHPDDFSPNNKPATITAQQTIITSDDYVTAQNALGGVVYAGGTMAFTAGYWALHVLKPDILAFVGCDMVYPSSGNSHFYGQGQADPLRDDITLQSLEAKSKRLQVYAQERHSVCINVTSLAYSRLTFPNIDIRTLTQSPHTVLHKLQQAPLPTNTQDAIKKAKEREQQLGYFAPSGEYWRTLEQFNASELYELDQLWLNT